MGDAVNFFLDNLNALLWRLLEFPLVFQWFFWFLVMAFFWWIFLLLLRIKIKSLDRRARLIWFCAAVGCSVLVASGVVLDRKWKLMEEELLGLSQQNQTILASGAGNSFNLVSMADSVKVSLQGDSLGCKLIFSKEGIQAVRLQFADPEVVAFVAAVDLTRFGVLLDTAISVKEQTTDFATRFDAEIAVNGEAGTSPGMDAPLGHWIGNYIINGNPILLKDNNERPFVYFDRNSKAYYSDDPAVITTPTPEMFNAIWGRFDLILKGEINIDPRDRTKDNRYPRTIVGMDSTGLRLILMVVDGSRPGYSNGFTMQQTGEVLKAFGVYYAMACDQGGSSCMYLKGLGIVNRPVGSQDRPVYTHLGLKSRY